jgi:hypothetical protein
MGDAMRYAKWVFRISGLYGLAALVPQYFLEEQLGQDYPPPVTHPEHFYGFLGVAVSWQVAFLLISQDPARFRPIMVPAVLEKLTFGVAAVVLFAQQRTPGAALASGTIDLVWGALFLGAFLRSRFAAEGPA